MRSGCSTPLAEYQPLGRERALAIFAFIGTLLIGPIAPLLAYLVGFNCRWVRRQAASSLNFCCSIVLLQLVLAGAMVLLTLFDFTELAYDAIAAAFTVVLLGTISALIGAKKSFDGELYEPPTVHRFIR